MNLPQNPFIDGREIYTLIVKRNAPMLTALEMCIEQLERFDHNAGDVQSALTCARKAVEMERGFQREALG